MLVTRGCSEMRKLAIAMGSRSETLAGLSGIGDLMLTCYGSLSRNRTVGKRLGQGEALQEVCNDSCTTARRPRGLMVASGNRCTG
jgi:glycerol-3-phosphate dehydrogenase